MGVLSIYLDKLDEVNHRLAIADIEDLPVLKEEFEQIFADMHEEIDKMPGIPNRHRIFLEHFERYRDSKSYSSLPEGIRTQLDGAYEALKKDYGN